MKGKNMLSHFRLPALLGLALCSAAAANERHFAYTYETAVLPPGGREIEVSNTLRLGRDQYYSALDHRLEFEAGVTEHVMSSFYLNWSNVTRKVAPGTLESQFEWQGISNEWKWKLSDPVADPLGFALYAELTYATTDFELEAKTLFDKKIGNLLLAANLVAEGEFETGIGETELEEIEIEADLGANYAFTPRFSAGLELRNQNGIDKEAGSEEMAWGHSALFLGPNLSYATDNWWVTFSVLPQLPALMKDEGGSMFVLDDQEKLNARLLFSFHLH
jgi:hypothetical protein